MKNRYFFFILFILILVPTVQTASDYFELQSASSSWKPVGPEGGNIQSMAFNTKNKNEICAVIGSYPGQVFRTTDGGEKWERIAILDENLFDIAFDPSNPKVVYALGSSKMYKTSNRGLSWENFSFGNKCYCEDGQMAINSTNPNVIYVAGYHKYYSNSWKTCMAVFKSEDGGKNWTLKKSFPISIYGSSRCISLNPSNPNVIYLGGYYNDGIVHYRFYKSIDAGSTWQDITGPILSSVNKIVIDPTNPSKVYVGCSSGVFRSSDGGQSWQANNGYVCANALAIDSSNPNILYAGYEKEGYKSVDGGVNWTRLIGEIYGSYNSLLVSSSTVYFGSSAGVYKSTDFGTTWTAKNSGITATEIPHLIVAPSSPNVIYANVANQGFFWSPDFGKSWLKLPYFYSCEDRAKIVAVDPYLANIVYMIAPGQG